MPPGATPTGARGDGPDGHAPRAHPVPTLGPHPDDLGRPPPARSPGPRSGVCSTNVRGASLLVGLLAAVASCGRVGFARLDRGDRGDAGGDEPDGPSAVSDAGGDASGAAWTQRVVSFDGGATWSGWDLAGTSCSATWVTGSTPAQAYSIYLTRFVLDPAQTMTAPLLAGGTPDGVRVVGSTDRLFEDGWQAGDHIVGLGVELTPPFTMDTFFFEVDHGGDSFLPASACGAVDGTATCNTGDTVSYYSRYVSGAGFQEAQYSVFTGDSPDCSNNYTVFFRQASGSPVHGPSRNAVVVAPGSPGDGSRGQFLLNLDYVRRQNGGAGHGEGTCGPSTRVGFWAGGAGGRYVQHSLPLGGCD